MRQINKGKKGCSVHAGDDCLGVVSVTPRRDKSCSHGHDVLLKICMKRRISEEKSGYMGKLNMREKQGKWEGNVLITAILVLPPCQHPVTNPEPYDVQFDKRNGLNMHEID